MADNYQQISLVIADISGSTTLYDKVGNTEGFRQVGECLEQLRSILLNKDGQFIRSKGDDVLGAFTVASSAMAAARSMVAMQKNSPLDIHIGIHYGQVINLDPDVFGDTVNLAARLASLAKPGEILVSDDFVKQVSAFEQQIFNRLDSITFKGKLSPTNVHTLLADDDEVRTRIKPYKTAVLRKDQNAESRTNVTLKYKDVTSAFVEGDSISIGRAEDCDIVIPREWVSRVHAQIKFRSGRIDLEDQSSHGTYVSTQDGYGIYLHRDNVLLTGSGTISPTVKSDDDDAEIIHYQIA